MQSFNDTKDHKTPAQSTEKVLYYSFDWDGSLAPKFDPVTDPQKFIESHPNIIKKIKADLIKYGAKKVRFLVGSNRQSMSTDKVNRDKNKNGSPLQGLEILKNHVLKELAKEGAPSFDLEVDPYLMVGVNNQPVRQKPPTSGEHFQGLYPTDEWAFEPKKRVLLLTQMHHAAKHNQDKEVIFQFFDDMQDILDAVNSLFREHPDLIPKNLTLMTHLYDSWVEGKPVTLQESIKGLSEINLNIIDDVNKFSRKYYPEAYKGGSVPVTGAKSYDWSNPDTASYAIFKQSGMEYFLTKEELDKRFAIIIHYKSDTQKKTLTQQLIKNVRVALLHYLAQEKKGALTLDANQDKNKINNWYLAAESFLQKPYEQKKVVSSLFTSDKDLMRTKLLYDRLEAYEKDDNPEKLLAFLNLMNDSQKEFPDGLGSSENLRESVKFILDNTINNDNRELYENKPKEPAVSMAKK
jgi:hypothetical protein